MLFLPLARSFTDQQIADDFFASIDYQQYLAEGGPPFSRDVFLQCKCFCIDKSDFEECACPPCTLMRENVRGWHRLRAKWHREHDKVHAPHNLSCPTQQPCISCPCRTLGPHPCRAPSRSAPSPRTLVPRTLVHRTLPYRTLAPHTLTLTLYLNLLIATNL